MGDRGKGFPGMDLVVGLNLVDKEEKDGICRGDKEVEVKKEAASIT